MLNLNKNDSVKDLFKNLGILTIFTYCTFTTASLFVNIAQLLPQIKMFTIITQEEN